jgi:3-isopropylmalate dehydrogenase
MKRILLIPGDGIGPEVMAQARRLLAIFSASRQLEFILTEVDWGAERFIKEKVGIPKEDLLSISDNYDAILFGALGDPRIPDMAHGREILLALRTHLDLFINLRPITLLHERLSPLKNTPSTGINIIIFRENTQDIYSGAGAVLNAHTTQEIALDHSIHSYAGVERIIRAAFNYAQRHNRSSVMLVDKSNAIKYGGSLWQRVFRSVAEDYRKIEAQHRYIDVAAMQFIQNPALFDVVVTSNLFGDILSDLGAGLIGGLGLAASANINPQGIALFEPIHGSAPDIAGKKKANPFAMFMAVTMMLEYFEYEKEARAIKSAIERALIQHNTTPDLGGSLSTDEAAESVFTELR